LRNLDLSLADASVAGLEFRRADILAGPVPPGGFDLVTARAVLHHVGDIDTAVANLSRHGLADVGAAAFTAVHGRVPVADR
jgi:ubiquinone/menaquinone biosynthesis C-methylase UbiE